ncbi:unnamed protein product [Boreogadus saida]
MGCGMGKAEASLGKKREREHISVPEFIKEQNRSWVRPAYRSAAYSGDRTQDLMAWSHHSCTTLSCFL